jgi:mRNA interferase MazF
VHPASRTCVRARENRATPRRSRRRVVSSLPARGEIWWSEVPEVRRRPVVVLSRDAAIPRLRRTLIGPCTTTIRGIPSEVLLDPSDDPIPRPSAVNLDSLESVSGGTLVERLGRLSDPRMRQISRRAALVGARHSMSTEFCTHGVVNRALG